MVEIFISVMKEFKNKTVLWFFFFLNTVQYKKETMGQGKICACLCLLRRANPLLAGCLCGSVKCKFTVVDLIQSKLDNFGLEIAQYCLHVWVLKVRNG